MKHRASLFVVSLSLLGCAAESSSGGDDGKQDGKLSPHAKAVTACAAALASAESDDAAGLLALQTRFWTCVRDANAVAADRIDELTPEDFTYSATGLFEDFEDAGASMCTLVAKLHREDPANIEMHCRGNRSHHLAKLIDGYVPFDKRFPLVPVAAPRTYTDDCFVAFEATRRTDAEAYGTLSTCIEQFLDGHLKDSYIPKLTFKGVAGARTQVEAMIKSALEHEHNACTVVSAAGSGGKIDTESAATAKCKSDAAALRTELLMELDPGEY